MEPLPVYSDKLRKEEPDIWHLVGAAVLVTDEDVISSLESFVTLPGEPCRSGRSG
jgi:hypothetical protein